MTETATPKFSVVMFGSRMHYAVPRILHSAGRLERLFTDICGVQGWPRLLSIVSSSMLPRPLRRLKGRVPEGVPRERLTSFPLLGMRYQLRLLRSHTLEAGCRIHTWAAQELSGLIIDAGLLNDSILFTFDRAGLECMEYVKARGGVCVMEQTVAPFRVWRRLVEEEQHRFPNWEKSGETRTDLSWFAEREEREWALADRIVCGSEFVRAGIAECGGPFERVRIVPYGVDERFACAQAPPHQGPLRVLVVGEVGLRKGAPYVLEVARRLKDKAEFRMVGPIATTLEVRKSLAQHVELTGQIPRAEVAAHFSWADVFFLPSLIEGSATVVYEALSAGLPVVCTPNTGSVVRHGHNGYIVPIRDVEAMFNVFSGLVQNPTSLRALAKNARASSLDYGLESYRERFLKAVDGLPITRESSKQSVNVLP
jgi:glycosyltransferase involved in cell wall biosynthesis